jgi:hypothetical protein
MRSRRGKRAIRAWPRRATTVVAVALLAAACTGSGASTADGTTTTSTAPSPTTSTAVAYSGSDFYAVPNPLPTGKPGTLLRYQTVPVTNLGRGTVYRVMYLSESIAGDRIAVTGTVVLPKAPAPAGGRHIVTVAHGTTGISDECAPSKAPDHTELKAMAPLVDAGVVVAMSDYEGLGTPGRHPYLIGASEGRSVLDAARAARELPGSDAGTELGIIGYSQGGHGSLFANQLAASWAPEFHVVGDVAGAPATEIPIIFQAAAGGAGGGFFYMMVAGFQAAYAEADPALILTPAGVASLDVVDRGCVGDVLRAYAALKLSDLVKPDPQKVPPWSQLVQDDNPGQVVTADPILILHSDADDVVPAVLSKILFDRLCGLHQVVERRVYEKGQTHTQAAPDALHDGIDWLQGRFEGTPPVSTCP